MVGGQEVDVDCGYQIGSQWFDRVEIRLLYAASIGRDGLSEGSADAIERSALDLVLNAARVNDLAPDIAYNPDVGQLYLAGRRYCCLDLLRPASKVRLSPAGSDSAHRTGQHGSQPGPVATGGQVRR
jgi:hypothetical protein